MKCLCSFLTILFLWSATALGQESRPLLIDLVSLPHRPLEVTTKPGAKVPAGRVELVDGQFGKACRFSCVESTGAQFFTASVDPRENWDEYEGFSFWVKGDGSKGCGGLEFIDGEDFGLRYGYCFPIDSTEWVKIIVPWGDLIPELAGPPVDAESGYAPSRFRNVWVGKWFYWREYPACSFTIERMQLEKKIDRGTSDKTPQRPGLQTVLAKLKAGQLVTLVTMGDSLSDKRHWANQDTLWSEMLAQKLKDAYGSEVRLINPAIGGTTLSQNVVLIPRWLQVAPSPDLVVIWFGGNDWDSGVRGARYRQYLRSAVDRVRRLTKGRAEILLMTTCPGFKRWETTSELCHATYLVAQERNTGFADAATAFHEAGSREEAAKRQYWAWDNVHLGPGGHDLIADTVFRAIQSEGLADIQTAENAYWMKAAPRQPVADEETDSVDSLEQDFANLPTKWKSRPLWFWNGPLDQDATTTIMENSVASGYYGFGILPTQEMGVAFMSPEFLRHYKHAVETASRLNLKMCLYDEFWFPSGSAGGLLKKQYPEALSKRLDKVEAGVVGPAAVNLDVPAGDLMAAVAMHSETKELVDLTSQVRNNRLSWQAPTGPWQVMLFVCVPDGARGLVDYLDPDSVQKFVELTYEKYYQTFPEHFGKTIDSAFYDEPTFHWVQGGRAWTPAFNQRFMDKFGNSPAVYYPALWYDIGRDTAAARNAMFGFRAELFADGFVKTLADWCREHGVALTGHVDQEEIVNPVGLCGDLIKVFQHQPIPGLDQVFAYDRGSPMYKVVSSAAVNYGRPLVMTECYGGMKLPLANLYREAMDQFAKGVNLMVPHAVWYRTDPITFPPELSYRTEPYASELPRYNEYIGRLQRVLQQGRPVVDIAVLYPIHGLQAAYHFGPGKPYTGGVIPEWADYMDIGERLSLDLRHDFTYLHPETLDARCRVADGLLELQQAECPQAYRVLILPGMAAVSASNLAKVKSFFDQGGKVLATTRLPDRSAEIGQRDEVRSMIRHIFGDQATEAVGELSSYPKVRASSVWQGGGHNAALAFDGDPETRWNAQDQKTTDQWLEVNFGTPRTFQKVTITEVFDRATSHRVEYWDGQQWRVCASGAEIGADRTHTFPPVTASRVRLFVPKVTSDTPSIAEIAVLDANGTNLAALSSRPGRVCVNRNANGGAAWFVENPVPAALRQVIDRALPQPDVTWIAPPAVRDGHLSYLHKEIEGRHFWFFANSSDTPVDTAVRLRGAHSLQQWDPHTGRIEPCPVKRGASGTTVELKLQPVSSVFLVSDR